MARPLLLARAKERRAYRRADLFMATEVTEDMGALDQLLPRLESLTDSACCA